MRFVLIGALSTGVYASLTVICVEKFHLDSAISSALAYGFSVPVSYVGQRILTFQSKAKPINEMGKFILVHFFNFLLAAAIMSFVTRFYESYGLGIAVTSVLVPIFSYILMRTIVFTEAK